MERSEPAVPGGGHAGAAPDAAPAAHAGAPRASLELLALAAAVALGAAWATLAGTLPGQRFGAPAAAVQGVLWAGAYAALLAAYRHAAAARVPRRLALALLLTLLTTHAARLLLAPLLAPGAWKDFDHLAVVLLLAAAGAWVALLLPQATRAAARAAPPKLTAPPVPQLAVLLAAALLLVSVSDLALHAGGMRAVEVEGRPVADVIMPTAWATNALILFAALALLFALTGRVAAALLVVVPLYLTLGAATLIKLHYMRSAVEPLDLLRLPEFLPLFRSFFGGGVLVGTLAAIAAWAGALVVVFRRAPARTTRPRRLALGLASGGLLAAFAAAFATANSTPWVDTLLWRLGAPNNHHREKARRNGFLLTFLAQIPTTFVAEPRGYSPELVERALGSYARGGAGTPPGREGSGVSLVLYMVESLMDPADLGVPFTADPAPNLHAIRERHVAGHAIVPEPFGGSANSEFEALTGMTRSFLPQGSTPYRQYVRHALPALPRALRELGYTTTAVQADPRYFYDRDRVYPLLGFDRVVWLNGAPNVAWAPRGRWPSDEAVVDAVIEAGRARRPFFVFAFPSSTHSPYDAGTYRDAPLDVRDRADDPTGELKEYINAVHDADRALGRLIDHYARQPDSTIVVVLGDHLPPLSGAALGAFSRRLAGASPVERDRITRRVPLLVWANFDLPRERPELGTSALPSYLLEKMRIAPTGFLAVTDALRRRVPVLSGFAQTPDGRLWPADSLPAEARGVAGDYRLLQYDLLLGRQYAPAAAARIPPPDAPEAHMHDAGAH